MNILKLARSGIHYLQKINSLKHELQSILHYLVQLGFRQNEVNILYQESLQAVLPPFSFTHMNRQVALIQDFT